MAKYLRYKNSNYFVSWCVTLKFFQSTFLTYIYNRVQMFVDLFGTLRLPRKSIKLRLLRSPHVNKKSMESFELRSSKYLTFIFSSEVYKDLRFLIDSMSVFYMHFLFEFNKKKIFIFKKWNYFNYLSLPLVGLFENNMEGVVNINLDFYSFIILVNILLITIGMVVRQEKKRSKIVKIFDNFKIKLSYIFPLVVFPVKFEEFTSTNEIKRKVNDICKDYVVEEDYEDLPVDSSDWYAGGWAEEIDKDGNVILTFDSKKAFYDPVNIDEITYDPTMYGKSKNIEFFLRKEEFIQKVLNVLGEQELKKLKQLYNAQWFVKDKDVEFKWSHFYNMETGEIHHVEDLYNWKLVRQIHEIFWLERQILDLNTEFKESLDVLDNLSVDSVSMAARLLARSEKISDDYSDFKESVADSVLFNNDKKKELWGGIRNTLRWIKNRHVRIPSDKYYSLKSRSYDDLKKSKSYPERSFNEIFKPYVLDKDGVIESKRTVVNIFGKDFTLPINFTEFDRQATTFINQFMHDWFWKEKTYKWSWEDFKTWLEEESIDTGLLTEEQLKAYAEGLDTRYTLENMFTYQKSWYSRLIWYTHDHPYYTRVMKDRVYSWVESFDDETGEASMMAFRDGFWIDTVSCSEYLKIVRGEQDLVNEREHIVYDAGLYYDQYSNSIDFARRVRWIKEYSETLNYYVDDLITDKLNFGDLALPKELLARDTIGWCKAWPSYGSVMWDDRLDYKLESLYLSWISIFHTNIWHVTTYGGLYGGLSWLLFVIILDIITSHRRMRKTLLGLRWRSLRNRLDDWWLDKTGLQLSYHDDGNAWMYVTGAFWAVKYYQWLGNKAEYVFRDAELKDNMRNLKELSEKRARIYSYNARREGYGFIDNCWEADSLDRVYRPAILKNTGVNSGRAGYFSEKQTELSNLWNPVIYAFDLLFTSISEIIDRYFFRHGLSKVLLKAVLVEAAFVNKILNTLLDIPIRLSVLVSVYTYQLFIFILNIPKEIFNLPGYVINISVAVIKSVVNLYEGITYSIKYLFEEIISLWFFIFNVFGYTLKLWFYLIFIKPFESIWNFLDYCFNINYWYLFFKEWFFLYKLEMFEHNHEIMAHRFGFWWIHKNNLRYYPETRMITDWTQEIEAFFNKKFSFMKLRVGARETFNIWYDDITWKAWLWLDNAVVVFNQIKYLGSLQEFFNFRLQRFCDHTLEYFFYKYYVAVIKDDPSREVEWAYFRWYLNEVYWPYIQEVFSLNLSYYKGFFVHEILNAYNKVFYLGTLSYYGLNWVHSFIYYPIFYIWRHTFGQAWVTLLYLANVIWHWDYYSFSGGLSFSRVISSFGYSFSIFVAHIFNFFVQLKLMFVEGCKFYVEGIFYPFICMYWYFVKTKDFFYDSFMDSYGLYVNIFYHSSISVYVRTLFNDFKTIYYMALGETSDLPNENKKLSVKESESLVEKLTVSELYNNKQKYSKDIVDTYEKNPEAYVTDSWNLDPKVTQASIDVYEELGKVNLFEDYYPLTPSERVLDSLDMLDKSQRNIDVLRAIGRWHESVILQTIVYENHIDTRNYSWGFDKLRIHAKIWVPLHDYLVDFISFSEIAPNLRRWIGETYVIWVLDSVKYFFYAPVMFQYIFGAFFKIPRYIYLTYDYVYNTLCSIVNVLIKLPTYLSEVFTYFATYLRVTYGLTFSNFDVQFFIDMFYYWYYYVPHSYWKPRYLQHIMKDHWLYTANRFNYINKTFNFKPDGRWQNWRAKTSLWNRVYLKYWEGVGNDKSVFWHSRFITFWQLIFSYKTPLQQREHKAKYIDTIKEEKSIKVYYLFDYIPYWFNRITKRYIQYESVEHWFLTPNLRYEAKAELKRNDQYVGGLYPFKGQELIDFYKKITSYYIGYYKEWFAHFIYSGIEELFWWVHSLLTRLTPIGFYFYIMLRAIHELKQEIHFIGTPNLIYNKLIVNADFHKEFTYVYFKFLFDFKDSAINFLTAYQIIIVDYITWVFNRWYVVPIRIKYNVDIIEIYNLPFSYYILFFTGVSKDLLWYYLKLTFSIIKFSLGQTWEGIGVIFDYIVDFVSEITAEHILLLKVKIGFSIVKYFQGLEERICTLEGLFFGLNEPKENFKESARLLFNGSLVEISNLFLNSIKFITLLFKYLFQSLGLILMWTVEDFWSYVKLILNGCYSLFGKLVFTVYELYVLFRVNFLYISESIFIYSVKLIYNLLKLFYGFCSAVYSWFFAMAAEYIIYFSNCIAAYFDTGYPFIGGFFYTCVGSIHLFVITLVRLIYDCLKYVISIFVHYSPETGRISYFNLERIYLKFFVYFTDFYMFCSSDEFWWNNVFFMHVYRSIVEPVTNFIRDFLPLPSERYVIAPNLFSDAFFKKLKGVKEFAYFQGISDIRAKGIRGDYNRKLPWLIGEAQDQVPKSTVNAMWDTFDYQGLSNAFPTRIRDLWSMNKYISGYILMLEKTNLPDPVKRHFYLKRMRELLYHSMVTLGGRTHTYKEIRVYFRQVFSHDIFGRSNAKESLAVYNKIHMHDKMLDAMDEVVRRYRVPDFMFRYWFTHRSSGRWKTPEIWNQLSDKDVFILKNDSDAMFDDHIRFQTVKIFGARDTYPRIFTHGYQNFHSRALDTYDFMAFNQKVYNFYLDMYGPTFAYILYHFPGHSLQLNADELTVAERVQWLKDFVYRTESNLISATSLVHRLSNFEFQKRMEHYEDGVKWNLRAQNNYYLTSHFPHYDAIKEALRWGLTNKLWGYSNSVDGRYSLQFPILEYDTIFNDDNFIETYYNSYFCGFGEEDMFGFDETWYPEWDIPQRDLGIRHAWKIPVDSFYTSDFIDYKNSILLQFLFKETYHYNCVWNPTNFKGTYQSDYKAWGVLPNGYAVIGDLVKIHRPDLAKEFWGHGIETEHGSVASYREYLYLQNRLLSRVDYSWMDTFRRTLLVTKDVYYGYMRSDGELFTHREARPVVIDAPCIDVTEYNNILHKRMNNKPLCYDYWVFYEDNVASSLNNFENLSVLNESMFYDAPSAWQLGFQDPASPIMEGIIDLHHDLCFFLILVSVFVSWVLFNIIYYFNSTNYNLKVRIQKWVHEEVRETLLDLVNMWYSFTIKLVDYSAKNKDNGLVNLLAQKCYNLTMLFIYWENTYFNKWYHDKELEHLVVTSKLHSNSLLPDNITDILKYIGKNDYNKVEYFFNEVEKKGYFVSKDNVDLYNQFKNDPNTTCYSNRLGTILSNLVSIRDLQLQLSNSYFTDMGKEKSYIDSVIAEDIVAYEKFEEEFEEYQLKEEFVWFPQLFTHNTTIEVIWTIIPAVILIFIAVPSFSLLYAMDQIWQPLFTIKVLGNQWYWSYEYC